MRERLPDYDIVATDPKAPIALVGPPGALAGSIDLHNPGEQKVVLRQATLKDRSGSLGEPVSSTLRATVLRPTDARAVRLRLAVDPRTPAGSYECEIEIGGTSRPAVLHVEEVFDLVISPRPLVLENLPGVAQEKQIVITNLGNVPFVVGPIGEVVIDDEAIVCRVLRTGLDTWVGNEDDRIEGLAVEVSRSSQEEMNRTSNVFIENLDGEVEVGPAATVAIPLAVTVPEGLHRNSRYLGATPMFTTDLEILVVPSRRANGTPKRPTSRSPGEPTPLSSAGRKATGSRAATSGTKAPAKGSGSTARAASSTGSTSTASKKKPTKAAKAASKRSAPRRGGSS